MHCHISQRLAVVQSHKPAIQRVQALADISRSALYAFTLHKAIILGCMGVFCHSNETRTWIANPPSSTQLEGTHTISPSYIRVRAVLWECGEGQTDRQTAVANIHFTSVTHHVKCNNRAIFCLVYRRSSVL